MNLAKLTRALAAGAALTLSANALANDKELTPEEQYAQSVNSMYELLSEEQKNVFAYDFTNANPCDKVEMYDSQFNELTTLHPLGALFLWSRTNYSTSHEFNVSEEIGVANSDLGYLAKECLDFNEGYKLLKD